MYNTAILQNYPHLFTIRNTYFSIFRFSAEILEHVKPLLAEHNVELDIVEFDDYVMPNTGVEDGSLDANYFQHQPYLNDFNAEQSTHIVSVATVHYEPMGIYPGKTASLDVFGK